MQLKFFDSPAARKIFLTTSLLVGLSISFIVFVLFLQTSVVSRGRLIFAAVLFILMAGTHYFIALRWVNPKLHVIYQNEPGVIVVCLILPLLFLPLIYNPPSYPISPLLRNWTDIAIQFESAANSQSVRFYASDIKLINEKNAIDVQAFNAVGDWQSTGEVFVLKPGSIASLQWVGTVAQSATLTILAPPTDGLLTVYWDRTKTIIELKGGAQRQVVLARKFSIPFAVSVSFFVAEYILLVIIFLVITIFLKDRIVLGARLKRIGFYYWLIFIAVLLSVVLVRIQVESLNGGAAYITSVQMTRHLDILRGQAPNPWQYRILSEIVAEFFIFIFSFLPLQRAVVLGFIVFRVLQNIVIFLVAFALYKRLSHSNGMALLGIVLLAGTMRGAFYDADLAFNTYFDVIFYLLAALLILNRHYFWVVILTVFASLNRETSGLIPFLLLAAILNDNQPAKKNLTPFFISLAVFFAVFSALRFLIPDRPLFIPYGQPPGPALLIYNLTREFTWNQLFQTLGLIPIIGMLFYFTWPSLWRNYFLVLCPVWFAIHIWASVVGETRLFLVPQALIFIPGSLFALKYVKAFNQLREA
ncbi:MAG: hypothetical protein HYX49_11490 [Chloroflexi bacterium]|nr:hypothetical protein [Chloroflexota bacterium]